MTEYEKYDIGCTLCEIYDYIVQATINLKKKNYDEAEEYLFCALHRMDVDLPAYVDSCGQMISCTIKLIRDI